MKDAGMTGYLPSYSTDWQQRTPVFLAFFTAAALVLMIFQNEFSLGILNLYWGEPVLLMAIAANLIYALHNKTLGKTYLDVPIAIYAVSLICSLFVAGFSEHSLGVFRREIIAVLVFYIIAWNFWTRRSRIILSVGIVFSAFFAGFIAIMHNFFPGVFMGIFKVVGSAGGIFYRGLIGFVTTGVPSPVKPIFAPFGHFNTMGAFLAMTVPLVIGLGFAIRRRYFYGLVIFSVCCLYLTYSRGAWAGFLVGMGLMAWFYYIYIERKQMIIFFIILVAALIILFMIMMLFSNYSQTMNFYNARLPLWNLVFEHSMENPLFGIGLAGVENYLGDMAFNTSAHSDYIQMLGDRGILGLLAYLQLIFFSFLGGVKAIKKGFRPRWIYLGATSGVAVLAVHSMVDHPLTGLSFKILLFAYLALMTTVSTVSDEKNTAKNNFA